MGCADYRIYCDGDSDGDGNDLLYGVLDEKSVLESDFPERFVFSLYVVMGCYFFLGPNLSKTKNIPPKAVIISDFCCTFAMSLMILLVLICSTKVSEKSDMAKS